MVLVSNEFKVLSLTRVPKNNNHHHHLLLNKFHDLRLQFVTYVVENLEHLVWRFTLRLAKRSGHIIKNSFHLKIEDHFQSLQKILMQRFQAQRQVHTTLRNLMPIRWTNSMTKLYFLAQTVEELSCQRDYLCIRKVAKDHVSLQVTVQL